MLHSKKGWKGTIKKPRAQAMCKGTIKTTNYGKSSSIVWQNN